MAQMSKLSALALDYLFGDRSVWASDCEDLQRILGHVAPEALAAVLEARP